MKTRSIAACALASVALLACAAHAKAADKKPDQQVKPMAGPRATALRATWLYISPSTGAQRVSKVQIGRELVVSDRSGEWIRAYANTDIEEEHSDRDEPMIGDDESTPPISGWMQAKGVIIESTPNGDQILLGTAAEQESLASDPRGPADAAQSARRLYRRLVEMYPNSPLAGEAAWRSADIAWQIQKHDYSTLPSAREKQAYLRQQMDEDQLKKVIKNYPRSRWAAFAAYDLIDNKLCGDWQGTTDCPEKESDVFLKYSDDYADGPRTAQALYQVVYRQSALADMYAADGKTNKSENAHNQARTVASQLKAHFPDSDYALRAAALVYKLDQGVPVYGNDRE